MNGTMELMEKTSGVYAGKFSKEIGAFSSRTINPSDIQIPRYSLGCTLGKSEYEDIALKIVEAAQSNGQWTGISYELLRQNIKSECDAFWNSREQLYAMIRHHDKQLKAMEANKNRIAKKAHLPINIRKKMTDSLGLTSYASEACENVKKLAKSERIISACKKSQQEACNIHQKNQPYASTFAVLGYPLRYSVDEMANKGYITLVNVNNTEVLVPTQKMIRDIYDAQHAENKLAA